MSERDELFDQRIHDAYEQIELSEEAQSRMLANLMAAQALRERENGGQAEQTQAVQPDVVGVPVRKTAGTGPAHFRRVQPAPKRKNWRLILPLAAVLLAAVVVVTLQPWKPKSSYNKVEAAPEKSVTDLTEEMPLAEGPAEEKATAADEAEAEASDTNDFYELDDADGAAAEEGALLASESNDAGGAYTLGLVDEYPLVTLKDGTALTALVDATSTVEVSVDRVGKQVGEAKASSFEGGETVRCTVFSLVDDTAAYAVRYEGEQTYWYCTPLD